MYRSFTRSNCSNGICAFVRCVLVVKIGKKAIFSVSHSFDAHSHIIVCIREREMGGAVDGC